MSRKVTGFGIIVMGIIYNLIETSYFSTIHAGSPWWPRCAEENICDGLCIIVFAIGWALMANQEK